MSRQIFFRIFLTTFESAKYTNCSRLPFGARNKAYNSEQGLQMERLVLGLIAVIGLHTAFVVYMAGIRWVDQNNEIAAGGRTPSGQVAVRPPFVPEIARPVVPPAPESQPPAAANSSTERAASRTPRSDSAGGSEMTYRRRSRTSNIAKTVPAFPARTPASQKNREVTFADRVILYKKPVSLPERPLTAVAPAPNNGIQKRKNNSLVAKLQWVYKKPWGLMKAVGSKLR
jgi:hypothetical protein